MDVPDFIERASERLRTGHRVNRITVRELLAHFGATRRGAAKAEAIRTTLDSFGIATEPDFQTAWIDQPIWLRLKDGARVPPSGFPASDGAWNDQAESRTEEVATEDASEAVRQADEQSESAPTSPEPDASPADGIAQRSDPTFRIGSLPAAHKVLVSVNQSDPVSKAITLMLEHDFSQLPVMQGEREVKGVINWKSIGSRQVLAFRCSTVSDCFEDARIVNANWTLFTVIPAIVEHGYVLVRETDRKITGIVTASDLSLQFQQLAEPFLLLREIELHVRGLLNGQVLAEDLDRLGAPPHSTLEPQKVTDLTFGEYVRLLQLPEVWARLDLRVDSGVLIRLLEEVRQVRNDVMHFDPDPMTKDELGTLKRAVRLMQDLVQFRS